MRRTTLWFLVFVAGAGTGGISVHFWQRTSTPDLPPRRLEAMVYLPLNDQMNRPFSADRWQQALDLLVKEFGGATLSAETEGCWLGADGRLRREPIRPVAISFDPDRLTTFRRTLNEIGLLLDQDAIYVRFEEPRILLLPISAHSVAP